jgi:hypothetical protein
LERVRNSRREIADKAARGFSDMRAYYEAELKEARGVGGSGDFGGGGGGGGGGFGSGFIGFGSGFVGGRLSGGGGGGGLVEAAGEAAAAVAAAAAEAEAEDEFAEANARSRGGLAWNLTPDVAAETLRHMQSLPVNESVHKSTVWPEPWKVGLGRNHSNCPIASTHYTPSCLEHLSWMLPA